MKNRNEGILDFLKKDKTQTAEQFFEIDRMGSKGAKGLILTMLDGMTPDANIEYKGLGREQADSIGYVRDYIKNSFLGKIDSEPTRGDNENADFAKYMDSEAWGENINFDTLLEAARELYEQAGDFFNETQTGSDTESRQETLVTLGANSIPAILLFYCLKYLGSSIMKMKKKYNNKRMTEPMSENKILKEYIMQNAPQQPKDASIIEVIADEVNETLNNLPEVRLASEVLSEDELKSLFSPLARQVVTKVHNQIGKKIKGMVAEAISIEEFLGVIQVASGVDSVGQALADLTPAQLLAIRQIIAREDEGSQYLSVIDQIQGARAADAADEEELDAQLPDEEPVGQDTDYEVSEDE